MNKSKLATFLSEFPWGLSIIIALLITILLVSLLRLLPR
jgi:hypothetical protein